MPVASIVSKRTYIAKEATPGTRQPPNKFLEGLNIRLVRNTTRAEVRPSGSTMRTARPLVQDWGTFSLADGSYLEYNSALYLLASLMGNPTTTTPAGGTVTQDHAMTFNPDGLNTRPTYTVASGYRTGTAEEALHAVFQAINFGFSRTGAPTVGGSGFTKALDFAASLGVNEQQVIATASGTITAGTFLATIFGQTATILWNANPGSLDSAIGGLSTIGTANISVASSGSLPATPATITFNGGTLANYDVPLITIDNSGLTGGSLAVTELQKGGITTVPVRAVQAPEWSVYMDNLTNGGTIGTTKVQPYSGEFVFSGLVNPDWVVDRAEESWDDEVLQVPDLSLNLVARNESTMRTIAEDLIDGDTYGVRYEALGPLTGEGTLRYTLRMDFVVQASENLAQFGDEGGAETIPLPLTIISDSSYLSGGFTAFLRNAISSL